MYGISIYIIYHYFLKHRIAIDFQIDHKTTIVRSLSCIRGVSKKFQGRSLNLHDVVKQVFYSECFKDRYKCKLYTHMLTLTHDELK